MITVDLARSAACGSGAVPEAAAARYWFGGGVLRLLIEADQRPGCPECDGQTRVSSPRTGVVSGPVGSIVGQSRFKPGLVVPEGRDTARP